MTEAIGMVKEGKSPCVCRECDHFQSIYREPGSARTRAVMNCALGVNIVTGEPVDCRTARSDEELCGREGKYWRKTIKWDQTFKFYRPGSNPMPEH